MQNFDISIISAGFGSWKVTAYYLPTGRTYTALTHDSINIDNYKSEEESRIEEGKAALLSYAPAPAYDVTVREGRAAVSDKEKGYTFYFAAGRFYDPFAPMHETAAPEGPIYPDRVAEAEEEAVAFLKALYPDILGAE